jgi:hypothetical protein
MNEQDTATSTVATDGAGDHRVVETNTWPIWVIAALPLLAALNNLVPWPNASMAAPLLTLAVASIVLSFSFFIAVIVLAWLDSRILLQRGVRRPMSWGWAVLEGVYVVGRSVVVRRRARGSLAPLWLWIASTVVLIVSAIIR